MRLLLLVTTRGPPESPLQVPLPPAPLVQMLEACTKLAPYTAAHSALVITGRLTELRRWLVGMLPPAFKVPLKNFFFIYNTFHLSLATGVAWERSL